MKSDPRVRSFRSLLPMAIVLAAIVLLAGCSTTQARLSRSLLPTGLEGPAPAIHHDHRTEIDGERVRLTKQYLEIHNPPLAARLPPGDSAESISFEPRLVVIHFTAIPTLDETLAEFAPLEIDGDREVIRKNGLLNVGIQFVVDRDGTIYDLYPETVISRHVIGLNHVAIGIENVGNGDLEDRQASAPLTEEQLAANLRLVRFLAQKYPSIEYMIGHQEYRELEDPRHPGHELFYEQLPTYRTEKVDPGRRFMRRLRRSLKR